uniref:Uncharacterized protein n=1 Tax=Panagrolaimus superbus TaxID=310955 RepID=A0A914Y094_9BILA
MFIYFRYHQTMSEPYFDRLHPKYKCCCGLTHVETGTKLICGLALAIYIISIILYFVNGPDPLVGRLELILDIIGALMVAAPIVGIKEAKPQYFLPYLCFLGFNVCAVAIQIPFFVFAYNQNSTVRTWIKNASPAMAHNETAINGIITYNLISCIVVFLLNAWFLEVIYKCYKYIKDKAAVGYNELTIPQLITSSVH